MFWIVFGRIFSAMAASLDDVDADLLETEEAIQRIEDTRPPEKNPISRES